MRSGLGILTAVACLLVAACGTGSSSSSGNGAAIPIAFFSVQNANSFATAEYKGVQQAAAEMNAQVTEFDAGFNSSTQVSQISAAVASHKFKAFVVMPVDGNADVAPVTDAVAAGIKVVATFNTVSHDVTAVTPGVPGMTATVASPLYKNGQHLAQLTIDACAGKNPCKVIYMPGNFSQASEQSRLSGLNQYLQQKGPNVKIVAQQVGGYQVDPAEQAMSALLQAHPDVNVYTTSGDQMAVGAQQALQNANLLGKVVIVGNGGSIQGIAAVRNGTWFATPVNVPFQEGNQATKLAIQAVQGKKVPSSIDSDTLSPIGPIATKQSLSTPAGQAFKGEWSAI